ncbi:MAG TPA: AgmX/PglI C-terminal domain-containing protein [Polyangia bacterium]|jgi:TonB family protein|nr:AgmX/PglI C-terminal domain-containing protein [Polyangia bacterium]
MPDSSSRTASLSLVTFALALSALSACATDGDERRAADEQERLSRATSYENRPRPQKAYDPAPAMKVDSEMGVLETNDVEDTLQAHFDEVRACYARAGKAQEYAGGRVVLHFLVGGDGHAEDVWVVESSLGNYSVERCLVEVGRGVVFSAPSGHKATTFDYPVEFRSTKAQQVLDIDGVKIDHDISVFLPQLAACGRLAAEPVVAIMYIEPSGFPGSVGLATEAALDEAAAECAVKTIQRWKMSASLPGRVLRANFSIPRVISNGQAAAEPSREASSASGRRRHR